MADDINISPDMINNLINILKNNSDNENPNINSADNDSPNISGIFSKIASNSSSDSTDSSPNFDFETIMKIKSIMEALNTKNDPKSNLLYSLKPYLRKSKQDKLDQYVNILKISQVSNLFKSDKGESK